MADANSPIRRAVDHRSERKKVLHAAAFPRSHWCSRARRSTSPKALEHVPIPPRVPFDAGSRGPALNLREDADGLTVEAKMNEARCRGWIPIASNRSYATFSRIMAGSYPAPFRREFSVESTEWSGKQRLHSFSLLPWVVLPRTWRLRRTADLQMSECPEPRPRRRDRRLTCAGSPRR